MSFRNLQPVSSVLITRLPATLELSLMAVLLALGLGIPAGVYTGLHRMHGPARLSKPPPLWVSPSRRSSPASC